MFTGIVESTGIIREAIENGSNRTFWIDSPIGAELKVDQSVSHSGVCLTVEEIKDSRHRVTAIDETLQKTNLCDWEPGMVVNLERCLPMNGRLDGHLVQGHVDATGLCSKVKEKEGSWEFEIEFPGKYAHLVIEKGSVCLNGISLTAFNVKRKKFTVAIIPYTYLNTSINAVKKGDTVNLEFDIIGKYITNKMNHLKK
jgi:riboflavin synthase